MLAAEDQQRPVDELQQELLLVPDAVSGRRKLAVRFDRDVLVAGGLETNVRAVPLEAEERRVDPSDRRSLDVAVRDPVLFGVGEHAHFAGLFGSNSIWKISLSLISKRWFAVTSLPINRK